jgi:hypothetical protein
LDNLNPEENFITRIRRIFRTGESYVVFNIVLNAFAALRSGRDQTQLHQGVIHDLFPRNRAEVTFMTGGDAFVVCRAEVASNPAAVVGRIVAALFPDRELSPAESVKLVRIYKLPGDYSALRERTIEYVEGAEAYRTEKAMLEAAGGGDGQNALSGPLNARAIALIERELQDLEIAPYIRTQGIYRTDHRGNWYLLFEEYHTAVGELQNDRFPRINLRGAERLFLELMRILDRIVLQEIMRRRPRITSSARISLNLAIDTLGSPLFRDFAAECPRAERENLIFELNRSDLFTDLAGALRAIRTLRQDGFGVALDGLTLDLLPYVNLDRIEADYVKIILLKDQLGLLRDPDCIAAVRRIDPNRIILCRCDHETAIQVGQAFGLTRFQGWLIDTYAFRP